MIPVSFTDYLHTYLSLWWPMVCGSSFWKHLASRVIMLFYLMFGSFGVIFCYLSSFCHAHAGYLFHCLAGQYEMWKANPECGLAAECSSCSFWKLWTFKHDTQVQKRVQPIWCFTVNVQSYILYCRAREGSWSRGEWSRLFIHSWIWNINSRCCQVCTSTLTIYTFVAVASWWCRNPPG